MSYGQSLLGEFLSEMMPYNRVENHRPAWLYGLELDFYFPELSLAIEFNGDQHYYDTTSFGSPDRQIINDNKKKILCAKNDINLCSVVASDLEYTRLVGVLKRTSKHRTTINKIIKEAVVKNKEQLSILNKSAIRYRSSLIKSYNSPTARKDGTLVRLTAAISAATTATVFLSKKDEKLSKKLDLNLKNKI